MKAKPFAVTVGTVAAVALLTFYLVIVSLAEGREAAPEQLAEDLPYFVFLFPGFGAQVGLVTYTRRLARAAKGSTALAGSSSGVSATAVVACCAHFIPTLLPVVGVSAVASVLAAWKSPLLILAILMNFGGIAYVVYHMRRMSRQKSTHIDPVCGMTIQGKPAATASHDGQDYAFCSTHCHGRFMASPRDYVAARET